MNARQVIDRLATLMEAPVADPQVEPDVKPDVRPNAPPAPTRPTRPMAPPSPDPWTVPPDYEPGQFPAPKAEDDEEAIESWLQVTQQPVQDWQWDGQNLRLRLASGGVETYTRQQLDDAGVFAEAGATGEMAFGEGLENFKKDGSDPEDDDGKGTSDDMLDALGDEGPEEGGSECSTCPEGDDAVQAILGLPPGESAGEEMAPQPAENLVQAVDGLVQAILGLVTDPTGAQAAGGEGEGTGELAMTEPDERPDDKYCPDQLAKGTEVEKEHTDDVNEAKKIAKDHLDEDPEYYAKLDQVEGK